MFSLETQEAWADEAAQHLTQRLAEATRDGRAVFAVAGGRTPQAILERLGASPLPWDRIDVIPTDERLAPEGTAARNVEFLRGCLSGAIAKGARIHALENAAAARLTRPTLVLLGMGTDGHVASLFPGMPRLEAALNPYAGADTFEAVPDPLPPEAPFARLSLTVFALACAVEIVLAATGEVKRNVIAQAREQDPTRHPLAAVLAQDRAPVRIFWAP